MSIRGSSTSVSLPEEAKQLNFVSSPPPRFTDPPHEGMEASSPNNWSYPPTSPGPESQNGLQPAYHRVDMEPPPSAQQPRNAGTNDASSLDKQEEDKEHGLEERQEDNEEDFDPAEKIPDFPWTEMLTRYHDAMNQATNEETTLFHEWGELMKFFKIWAEAGVAHESDRSFSRLKTRAAYVQNSEHHLEATRKHYTDVVKAFESALALLKNTGFRR